MPRLRTFRRKSRADEFDEFQADAALPFEDDDAPFVPFVSVESERSYSLDEDDASRAPYEEARRRGRPQFTRPDFRPASPIEVRPGMLGLAAALIALGIFGTLLNRGEVEGDVRAWWPAALIAFAVLWMLVALVRQRIPSFLGAAAVAGVGVSLLLDTQGVVPVEETLLGLILVAAGLGIVVRGFLLRQTTYGA